jgi:hypothetical protein
LSGVSVDIHVHDFLRQEVSMTPLGRTPTSQGYIFALFMQLMDSVDFLGKSFIVGILIDCPLRVPLAHRISFRLGAHDKWIT